jgi:hypothetical protein
MKARMHAQHPTRRPLAWLTALALASTLGLTALPSMAQNPASPLTRADAKAERDAFLKTHRWDEQTEVWVLKSGVEPPFGVKSRAEVKAARDAFLSKNRWNDVTATWDPIQPQPRVMSTLTRSQVRRETIQFLKTHNWDEEKEVWVNKPRSTIRP